jgi:hypothetical protein
MSLTPKSYTRVANHATTSLLYLYVRFNADISWNHRDIISLIELVIFPNLNHAFLFSICIAKYILSTCLPHFSVDTQVHSVCSLSSFLRWLLIDLGHISFFLKVNFSVGSVSVYSRNNCLKVGFFVLRESRLQTHTCLPQLSSKLPICKVLKRKYWEEIPRFRICLLGHYFNQETSQNVGLRSILM